MRHQDESRLMTRQPYRSELTGWGRFPRVEGLMFKSEDLLAITGSASLSRGLGRSYGDSSLPAREDLPVADTTLADRLLKFDPQSGLLRAEAGVSLRELNRVFLPRGWFVPVSPGTQFVTLGGMAASDVHGKNHHVDGCFGQHVRSILLRVADGRILECSDDTGGELFRATIGGMGLTGHILQVEFSMRRIASPWIWGESERVGGLDAMVSGLKDAAGGWPMTVGWVDCLAKGAKLGRGILMKGRWAEEKGTGGRGTVPIFVSAKMGLSPLTQEPAKGAVPFSRKETAVPRALPIPGPALCRPSMKAFNLAYYWKHISRLRRGIVHPQTFFYPLDALDDWNLIYGRRGFTQYQCVLPKADDNGPARRFLELFIKSGGIGFLCVIKDCGAEGKGMLSFPRPGISIALDFPIHPAKTQQLVDRLNELVIAEGGRIYLTKDAFTRAEHFRAMEPRLDGFNAVRRKWDPDVRIRRRSRSDCWETLHESSAFWR